MPTYGSTIEWKRGDAPFTDLKYSRAHAWHFDSGAVVRGSSSPHSVRVPYSDPGAVDPEEALVAAVASCHMLWFLSLAAESGLVVDSYRDDAEGRMGRFDDGKLGITEVLLRPALVLLPRDGIEDAAIGALHDAAHARCNIGNSLRGTVRVQGRWQLRAAT